LAEGRTGDARRLARRVQNGTERDAWEEALLAYVEGNPIRAAGLADQSLAGIPPSRAGAREQRLFLAALAHERAGLWGRRRARLLWHELAAGRTAFARLARQRIRVFRRSGVQAFRQGPRTLRT